MKIFLVLLSLSIIVITLYLRYSQETAGIFSIAFIPSLFYIMIVLEDFFKSFRD